jgi:hypothetical protein
MIVVQREILFLHFNHLIQNPTFRMNKITISTGTELYQDIEQISRQRLSSQTLSNVKHSNCFVK